MTMTTEPDSPLAASPMVRAPFTAVQVASLNGFQQSGSWHQFTCGNDDCPRMPDGQKPSLFAEEDGWHCPAERCYYTQDWAHGFMADFSWADGARARFELFAAKDEQPFAGHPDRECGEHRTTGDRAWCHADSEWCYPDIGEACRGCRLPAVEATSGVLAAAKIAADDRIARALSLIAEMSEYGITSAFADHLTRVLSEPAGDRSEPPEPTNVPLRTEESRGSGAALQETTSQEKDQGID